MPIMKKCCQKSLYIERAKFCGSCGLRLHRTLAEKEYLFFMVGNFFDNHNKAVNFVEDYDKYGEPALNWHGLCKVNS